MTHEVHAVLDDPATVDTWLARCEALHRTLRPALPADYAGLLRTMFREGAAMAVLHDAGKPLALAVFRHHHTTFQGLRFYVDDLVTDEALRGAGHGAALLDWCEARARALGCDTLALDSGVQRAPAHRFYFRLRFAIASFGFTKAL
jgi:GNAT superfamily N-acetyltransferase